MKRYHTLIWGTGDWCRRLLKQLPDNCIIEAFIETKKDRDDFWGMPVISSDDFSAFYKKTDMTIVAVKENDEIKKMIYALTGTFQNVFFMENECLTACPADGRGWFSVGNLFDDVVYNSRQEMYTAPYVVSCCAAGVNMLVNSKNRMFLNGVIQGEMHQENDIYKFLRLSEHYYDIPADSCGFFLDIGANIGTTCIYVKKVINPALNILAFEMEKENCRQLKCNKILNDIPDAEMQIIEAGLSNVNEDMECMLSIKEDNMGDHRIIKNGNYNDGWKKEQIHTIRLDDWLDENEIDRNEIRYIWMDVQGHEGFVLDGASATLKMHKIPLIIEFWPAELKQNGSWELLLKRTAEYYSSFICMKDDSESVRPIHELAILGEEYKNSQCDVFLIK